MRILLALVLALAAISANAGPLAPVRDKQLASLVAFQTVLAEKSAGSYSVKVLVAPYRWAECDGTVQSCPDTRLYISVVPDGLGIESRLYRLPDAKKWEFGAWLHINANEDLEPIAFTLKTSLPDSNIEHEERAHFKSITYQIQVNRNGANVAIK